MRESKRNCTLATLGVSYIIRLIKEYYYFYFKLVLEKIVQIMYSEFMARTTHPLLKLYREKVKVHMRGTLQANKSNSL